MAKDLTKLLSEVWGPVGFWLLIVGVVIALSGTILANQDGWPRMFADATHLLLPKNLPQWLGDLSKLKNLYVIVTVTLLPLLVFFLVRDPVEILSVAGIVAAAHTPVVVFLTLYLNKRTLPSSLQPKRLSSAAMLTAGAFFTIFALLYFLDLLR